MKKWMGALFITGAAALVSLGTVDSFAGGKKTTPKTGTIEISESSKDGKFRFSIYDAERKYLGGSGPVGYATEKAVKEAVEDLKKVLATATVTTKKAEEPKKEKDKDK